MTGVIRLLLAALIWTMAPAATAIAQTREKDLANTSLEELMNIEITSASHKEQRAADVPASVDVITQEDIRRSGMTTVPELLRLVPGVQVAQINSNKWAVTVRGFNNLFADKLLVLVDGRTVYDRLNSGLFWESLDIPLDQIDRIEIIRGPGGATWGANAVNGVINIVTKSAASLPGGAVSIGAGTFDGVHAAARYGGTLGGVAYRVYAQGAAHRESQIDATTSAEDQWQSHTQGFRLDWTAGRSAFAATGSATHGKLRALFREPTGPVPAAKPVFSVWSGTEQYNLLGRWTRHRDNGATIQAQSSIDYRHNDDGPAPTQINFDLDAQYHTVLWARHDVVVGGGYRVVDERVRGSFTFSIDPAEAVNSVIKVFAQDEIAIGRRVYLTLGTKLERDSYAGWALQPTARMMFRLPSQQHVWAAVSRAVRTPSLGDVSVRNNFTSFVGQGGLPVVVGAIGNPAFRSEEVLTTEAGYRREIGSVLSVDVTAFVSRYDKLKTSEPLPPRMELAPAPAHLFIPVQFGNLLEATASGVEVAAHWAPAGWWRLDGGWSTFHLSPHRSAASGDVAAASYDGNAPRAQWQMRSAFSLARGVEVDAMVFHVGALRNIGIAAYTRADARLQVPLARGLFLSFVGQNLFDSEHREYGGTGAIVVPTLIPRSASIRLVWKSRP
jgi:iron complex outermembrane receptor protein